ncbi:MAG: dTDP-4-dehydrorhamnose 3,5-epimerase, partial [Sphingomonadales bacterium]|nr:dTDP-4-dehydrorhamnose 3,5-epimerase [Sphingomonadales bacterium]
MIDGVSVTPLKVLGDERGAVLRWMRPDTPSFKDFGEAYFSKVAVGAVKAWKRHNRMTLNLTVPVGRVRFVLYDARPESPTKGEVQV